MRGGLTWELFEKSSHTLKNFYGTADIQSGRYLHERRKYLRRGKREK